MATSKNDFKSDSEIIVFHQKFGYLRAWALQDFSKMPGASSWFHVRINDKEQLPGVEEMVINTNIWDVWHSNDPEVLVKIAEHYVKRPVR